MGLFDWLSDFFSDDDSNFCPGNSDEDSEDIYTINPASGLPMIGGIGGVDIEGNPYGIDSFNNDDDSNLSPFSSDDNSFTNWNED